MRKGAFLSAAIVIFAGCISEKGSISGKVTNGGVGQKNAIVLAIVGDSLINGQSIDYTELKGTITSTDGSYKILLVDEGSYIVAAIKDDGDYVFEDSVDEFGYYGVRDTLLDSVIVVNPLEVTVDKGEDKTEIDIDTLYTLKH